MGAKQPGCVISYEHTWIHCHPYAPLPPNAVVGGHDCDGAPIYVGRSYHEGDHLPAKVVPSKGCAYVCWGGEEHSKTHYEILVGQDYAWVICYGNNVPAHAVRSGNTKTGEPLYVGRARHANSLVVGKIQPSHGCLYIPFGGREIPVNTYEVLVHEQRSQWLPSAPTCVPPMAVVAGHDVDSAPIYVGRAQHEGEMLPAKVVPSKGCAYVCSSGYEFSKHNFEVLTGPGYVWLRSYPRHLIPTNAVQAGYSIHGEPRFIGRGFYQGSLTPGVVSVSQRCLLIPFGGREIRLDDYEILCRQ